MPDDVRLRKNSLHNWRVQLVRQYLINPGSFANGLDRPLAPWFAGQEYYWVPLAIAEQAKLDAETERAEKMPKRKPLVPPRPGEGPAKADSRLKTTTSLLKNAERILLEVKNREVEAAKVAKVNVNKPRMSQMSQMSQTSQPAKAKIGRPRSPTPNQEALRKRRSREQLKKTSEGKT